MGLPDVFFYKTQGYLITVFDADFELLEPFLAVNKLSMQNKLSLAEDIVMPLYWTHDEGITHGCLCPAFVYIHKHTRYVLILGWKLSRLP